MDAHAIRNEIDRWISEEELPAAAHIKPIKQFDGLYPDDQDEYEAWCEFVFSNINKEHEIIMTLPAKDKNDYWMPYEPNDNISFPFSSIDFLRKRDSISNKARTAWQLKRIYERVKDLAQTYASISDDEGKKNTEKKYQDLINTSFRNEQQCIIDHLKQYGHLMNKDKAAEKLQELDKRIKRATFIWLEYINQR